MPKVLPPGCADSEAPNEVGTVLFDLQTSGAAAAAPAPVVAAATVQAPAAPAPVRTPAPVRSPVATQISDRRDTHLRLNKFAALKFH